MNKVISVIVPIYKTAAYLPECVDSLIAQTYENLEILLVDDGSPDESGAIADAYAAKDPRIKVFHKENGGVSSARNLGIQNATGEYIAFVDSDDAVDVHYFEKLMRAAREQQADVCFCISSVLGENTEVDAGSRYMVMSSEDAVKHLLLADLYGCAPNKMYRAELFCEGAFCEGIAINEDLLMNFDMFRRAERIVFLDEKLYHYRHREGSASRSGFNKKQLDIIKVNQRIVSELEGTDLYSLAQQRYYGALSGCHKGTLATPGFTEERKQIQKQICKEARSIAKNPHIPFARKAELYMQGYLPAVYQIIYRILRRET